MWRNRPTCLSPTNGPNELCAANAHFQVSIFLGKECGGRSLLNLLDIQRFDADDINCLQLKHAGSTQFEFHQQFENRSRSVWTFSSEVILQASESAKMSSPHQPSPIKDQVSRQYPDETDAAALRPQETSVLAIANVLAPTPTNVRTARVREKRYRVPSMRVKGRNVPYTVIRGRRGRKGEEVKRIGLNEEWTDPEPPITVCYNSDCDSDSDAYYEERPEKRKFNQVNVTSDSDRDEVFEFSWFEQWWYSINSSKPTEGRLECEGSASDGHRANSNSNLQPDEGQPSCSGNG
ncbi:hypothetical protein R1sor_013427 [Riccia sorocarpa]|uniref:Uncharacterized protein n=1 Tax=Riccia sorocarpa TaxID=122646 RepID=A0ABD3H6M3_9MARC